MPILVKPAGDTDFANAALYPDGTLPQTIALTAGDVTVYSMSEGVNATVDPVVSSMVATHVVMHVSGQSNTGNGNVDGTGSSGPLPLVYQGQWDRTQFVNIAHLNDAQLPETEPLQLVETGRTIDGITGPAGQIGSSGGTSVGAVGILGAMVADTPAGADLLPDVGTLLINLRQANGSPVSTHEPGGGAWNSLDAGVQGIIDPIARANAAAFWLTAFFQGEKTSTELREAAGDVTPDGSGDPAVIIPSVLTQPAAAEYAAKIANIRTAQQAYYGMRDKLHVIGGLVLPDRGANQPYTDNDMRAREVVFNEYLNIAQYVVKLNPAGDAIIITDLGPNLRTLDYDAPTDTFTTTITSTPSPHKSPLTFVIDARGIESEDNLHFDALDQVLNGTALRLILEEVYDDGAVPTSANLFGKTLPVLHGPPIITSVSDTTAIATVSTSEARTLTVHLYPDGATPTDAEVKAGTGALVSGSSSANRRQTGTVNLLGLSAETTYVPWAVLDRSGIDAVSLGRVGEAFTTNVASGGGGGGGGSSYFVGKLEAFAPEQDVVGDFATFAMPAGIQTGDTIYPFQSSDEALGGPTYPNTGLVDDTDWNLIQRVDNGNPGYEIHRMTAGATPPTSVDIYRIAKNKAVGIYVVRGYGAIEAGPATVLSNSTNIDPDALTSLTADALSFAVGILDDDEALAGVAVPAGYSNLMVANTGKGGSPGSQGGTIMVATRLISSPSIVDPGPFVVGDGDINQAIHWIVAPV